MFLSFFTNVITWNLHGALRLQNNFTSTEKIPLQKAIEEKIRGSVFPFYLFYPLAAVAVVGLKIPTGVVEPLGPWERRARSTWCTCSDSDDVCRWFTRSPTRCSAWRLQVVRLAIHVWPNMSGTYVHNLQRTTPTAFCRFSCVLRARFARSLTCHRAHHHH